MTLFMNKDQKNGLFQILFFLCILFGSITAVSIIVNSLLLFSIFGVVLLLLIYTIIYVVSNEN